MISKVAPPITDAAVATPVAVDSAESGVFDVLMALQSLASSGTATAATAVKGAPQASLPPGTELLASMLEDSDEDANDDVAKEAAEPAEDALWFLSALLPAPKVPPPVVLTGSAVAAHFQSDMPLATAPPPTAAQAGTVTELAQAFAFGPAGAEAGDPQTQTPTPNSLPAVAPVIDTTTWSSMTGSAELFAQAAKQGTVERADSTPLTTHVRDPRWADDLGNRLASMVRTGESSASLQLSPPDLGPLEVNVSVKENQATVHFGASNADTRALLEASMPRLREMLASQGFQLMDSSVSHGFARQTRHEAAGTPRFNADGDASALPVQAIHITGLLDLYA